VYYCCGRTFKFEKDLLNHEAKVHNKEPENDSSQMPSLEDDSSDSESSFDSGNDDNESLFSHFGGVATIGIAQRYAAYKQGHKLPQWLVSAWEANKCHYCDQTFPSLIALDQHQSTTSYHKVFSCCGRTFLSKDSLRTHEVRVHGETNLSMGSLESDSSSSSHQDDDESSLEGEISGPGLGSLAGGPNVRNKANSKGEIGIITRYQEYRRGGRTLPVWLVQSWEVNECHYCRKQFSSLAELDAHQVSTTSHDVFYCCGRTYATAASLESHRINSRICS
jgi:hypothetical protein